ncbi:MAG: hypothetical protein ABIL09_13020 [Gemmatimonadota bacterium]
MTDATAHFVEIDKAEVVVAKAWQALVQENVEPRIDGFGRGEILPLVEGNATSMYDSTYLTGVQGSYGFAELLDELNAYINGLGAVATLGDEVAYGFSARDGAVTLLYYLERGRG